MIERRGVAVAVCAYAVAAAGLTATTPHDARAQMNNGRIAFNMGLDASHAYFFRGLRQERAGIIVQPYFDATFSLLEGGEGLHSIGLTVGQWNSVHSSAPAGPAGPYTWYESDFISGLSFGLANW